MTDLAQLIKKAIDLPALSHIYAQEVDRQLRTMGKKPITFSARGLAENAEVTPETLGLGGLFPKNTSAEPVNAIFRAETLIKEGKGGEALAYAFTHAQGEQINALNLLYANHATQRPELRLHYLNKYLRAHGLRIELAQDKAAPFFHRLSNRPPINKVDGPLVTVIMPAHNAEGTIELAVGSLLNQTWQNLQIIIVDDASTDSTPQKVKDLAKRDPRVEALRSPVNVGPYVCRNLGVLHTRGEWLTVHDADDCAFPDRIEQQVQALTTANALACTGRMLRMNEQGQITRPTASASTAKDGYLRLCFVSLMVQTAYFRNELGAWDSVRVGGDAEMIERLKVLGTPQRHLQRPVMLCLDHEAGLTNHQELGLADETGQTQPLRADYKHAFTVWHKTIGPKKLSVFGKVRSFDAPKANLVDQGAIKKVFATWLKNLELIKASELFDADWYKSQYHGIEQTGLEAAEHYLVHGATGATDPSPDFSSRFYLSSRSVKINPLVHSLRGKDNGPNPKRVLLAAAEVAKTGAHERAISLAETHLPAELAYTAHVLKANAALAKGDEAGWQTHINAYLSHFDVAPIRLSDGKGTLFDRLATGPLQPVTDGPLITVIMPAWNAERTVRKAAQSILNQTWRNLELLIVDDASTDGTWALLQAIAAADTRVKIFRNKVNVGPYVSKNIALTQAKGAWITGHDADDWAHPQRLERHMDHLLSSNTPIPASRTFMLRIDPMGKFVGISSAGAEKIDGVFQSCAISTIFNMEFFKAQLGGYDCARFGADNELISRLQLITGKGIDEFPHLAMICQSLEGSLTNNADFGIGGKYGLTPGRKEYKSAWQEVHATHGHGSWVRYTFPPSELPLERLPFKKPDIANVDPESIRTVLSSDDSSFSNNFSETSTCNDKSSITRVLRRIVFVITDASTIGGIPNRTRLVLAHTAGRHIGFHAMTLKNEFGKRIENAHCLADDADALRAQLAAWSPHDTVFVVSNNMLKPFPADIVARVEQFPIVYFSAGQMAFFIQNSTVLLDRAYVDRFRATRIVSLSEADIRFQQQLGIFGQIKGMVPVAQRATNSFDPARNRRLGYVGRIDFHAKDCMRLIDVARAMKGTPWMPMQVFTTDGRNSPEYTVFRRAVAEAGLEDQFEFVVNCTDKDRIYNEIGALLLPSKMEGFGNVVVEAFSYGIPVIAASYAPGPAETIQHGQSGFLLDAYTGAEIRRIFDAMTPERWQQLSAGAFARHKDYSLDVHVEFLERICTEALEAFEGQNRQRVFPVLKMAEEAEKKIVRAVGKGVQI